MDFLFADPFKLWGLLFTAVPIILYLWSRNTGRIEYWGATWLLQRVLRQQRRSLQLQSLLVTLLRTACVFCVAIALANPVTDLTATPQDNTFRHHLILLDSSMSMSADESGETPFERGLSAIRTLLEDSRPGDSFQLVAVSAAIEPVLERPAFETQLVHDALEQLRVTNTQGELTHWLTSARALLELAPAHSIPEVFLLTDLRQIDWNDNDQIRRELTQLEKVASFKVVNCSQKNVENSAIVNVEHAPSLVAPGEPVEVRVTGIHYGKQLTTHVDLLVDGQIAQSKPWHLRSDVAQTIRFEVSFNQPGVHLLEARMGPDALEVDNRGWDIVHVVETLHALVFEAPPDGLPTQDSKTHRHVPPAHTFLELAVNGTEARSRIQLNRGQGPLELAISPLAGANESHQQVDVLFLCDFADWNAENVDALHRFVSAGGGLWVAPGPHTDPTIFRASPDLQELLPAPFVDKERFATNPPAFRIAQDHPLTIPFKEHPESGLETTRIYEMFKVGELSEGTEVILQTELGEPLLLERSIGRGRVLQLTTALDPRWSSLVVWPSFLPLINEATWHLARSSRKISRIPVADEWPALQPPQENWTSRHLGAHRPVDTLVHGERAKQHRPLSRLGSEASAEPLRDEPPLQPGIYRSTSEPTEWLIRTLPVEESDLRAVSIDELQSHPLLRTRAQVFRYPEFAIQNRQGGQRISSWATVTLLLAAFMGLLIEPILRHSLAAGLTLLFGSVITCGLLWLQISILIVILLTGLLTGSIYWLLRHTTT